MSASSASGSAEDSGVDNLNAGLYRLTPPLLQHRKRPLTVPQAFITAEDQSVTQHWQRSSPTSQDNAFNLLFLTRARSSLPALKCGTYFAGTCTILPDFGLRPVLGPR